MRIHLSFDRFLHETQDAIDEHRSNDVIEYFQMADRVLSCAFPKMRSLFHVVFVEHLKFDDAKHNRSWALELLTPRLKNDFRNSLGCSQNLRDCL